MLFICIIFASKSFPIHPCQWHPWYWYTVFVSESNPTKEPLAFQCLPPWSQHWWRMSVVCFRFILKSVHCVSIGFMIRIKSFHMVTAVSLYDFHNTKLLFLLWNKGWCDGLNYLIKWDDVKNKEVVSLTWSIFDDGKNKEVVTLAWSIFVVVDYVC